MTFPALRLSGSPYDQGLAHGAALRDRIEHNRDVYFDRFWREGGVARGKAAPPPYQGSSRETPITPPYERHRRRLGLPELEIVALNAL